MIVGILKAYVFKHNVSIWVVKLFRARLVKYLYIRVHYFKKTLNTRHSVLKLFRKFDNAPNGGNKCGNIKHIRHQIPRRNNALYHKNSAHRQHQNIHQPVKYLYRSMKQRHIPI